MKMQISLIIVILNALAIKALREMELFFLQILAYISVYLYFNLDGFCLTLHHDFILCG